MLRTREVKKGNVTFTIYEQINGRMWQQIQKFTHLMNNDRMTPVDYSNEITKLFVTKMVVHGDGEENLEKTVTNIQDIINQALDMSPDIIDDLGEEIAEIMDKDPFIKKKMG